MSIPIKSELKQCAKRLKEILVNEFGKDVNHTEALALMARIYGFKNWQTLSAVLERDPQPSTIEGITSIELIDYLLEYPNSAVKVQMNTEHGDNEGYHGIEKTLFPIKELESPDQPNEPVIMIDGWDGGPTAGDERKMDEAGERWMQMQEEIRRGK